MKTIIEFNSVEYFVTTRLVAHRLTKKDLEKLRVMDVNKDVMQTLGGLRNEEQTLDNLRWNLKQWDDNGFGLWMFYLKETGEWIGRGGLRRVIVNKNTEIEVGYALMPQFWNQGLATEITKACIEIAFELLHLDNIVSFTLTTNKASQRVMQKSGLIYENDIIHADIPHVLYRIKNIKEQSSNNSLIAYYQQQLNLTNAEFHPIEHEDAIVAAVYEISKTDGTKYILKICHRYNDYLCERYFLKYFLDTLPVPHIANLIEPTKNTPGAILMEYIDGQLLSSSILTNDLARETGLNLAKIHTNKARGFGDLTQSQDLSNDPTSYFSFKFEEGITECNEHLPKSLLEQCQQYYFDNLHLLNETDGPCIVHRDYRPGNLIVQNGILNGIIDWSSARASFAEEDFCSIGLSDLGNENSHKNAFLEGYASIRPIPNYNRIMPLLLLSKSVATLGFTVKTKTWNNKNTALYKKHRQLLETILKKYNNEN